MSALLRLVSFGVAAAVTLLMAAPATAGAAEPAADATPSVAAHHEDEASGWSRDRGRGRGRGRGWGNGRRGRWSDVVGMAANATGEGYWVATKTGRVYALGGAPELGSPQAGTEVVAIAAHATKPGYWVLASNGRVWGFGASSYLGSAGAGSIGIASLRTGEGYWVANADGRVRAFGKAVHHGDARSRGVVVDQIVVREDADGYYLRTTHGQWLAYPEIKKPREDRARDRDRERRERLEEARERRIRRERAERRRRQQAPTTSRERTRTPTPTTGGVGVTTVRGITVARSIADDIRRLMNAADRDGVRLGGWGYRSTARQIELRRAHCGTTRYAIYEMPSSQCSPPTARPGASMHEKGLAIDFYKKGRNGAAIPIGGTREFRWLKRNAARFGLYNLPSEPWHWSTNGR